jgi:translation elongation factor EF-G
MLDAVLDYLPSPLDIAAIEGIVPKTEEEVQLVLLLTAHHLLSFSI